MRVWFLNNYKKFVSLVLFLGALIFVAFFLENTYWKNLGLSISLSGLVAWWISLETLKVAKSEYDLKLYDRKLNHYNKLDKILCLVKRYEFVENKEVGNAPIGASKILRKVPNKNMNEIRNSMRILINESKKLFGEDIKQFLIELNDDINVVFSDAVNSHSEPKDNEVVIKVMNVTTEDKYKKYLDL